MNNPLNPTMRWAFALGSLLVAAMVRAESAMDLDSPFLKTALIQGGAGAYEERVIRKARLVGTNLEMEKESGGVALFPQSQVAAILPRLPSGAEGSSVADLQKAISFLQNLPAPFRERPETKPEVLEGWRALIPVAAKKESQKVQQNKQMNASEVAAWASAWSDFRKSRTTEEIQALKSRGQALRKDAPTEEKTVEEGLAFLAQWQARPGASPLPDLEKVDAIAATMEPEDLPAWIGAGLLVASFFGLLMGLSFVSSGLTRFKDGAWLGGLIFLPFGFAILGGLFWVWVPSAPTGSKVEPALSPGMEKLVFAGKNSAQPAFYFPPVSLELDGEEVPAGLMAAVSPAEEPTGFLKARFRAGTLWLEKGNWTYRQPLTVVGVPLPISFTFTGTVPSLTDWRKPSVKKAWLGRVPLPGDAGDTLFQSVLSSWGQAVDKGGLGRVQLKEGESGKIRLEMAASGKRPEVKAEEAVAVANYRKEISAEDLAQAFVDGHGKEFAGKFVLLDGILEKVESGSEVSGGTSAVAGGGLDTKSPEVQGSQSIDVFFLRGLPSHGVRKDPLEIRCLIKSQKVFVMDTHGDLYEGPHANTSQAEPIIKKGQRVKFLKEGRVESAEIKNNFIEVYGIRLDDPNQDIKAYDPNQPPAN